MDNIKLKLDDIKQDKFTIQQLINFVKDYDDCGENAWPENKYEGKEFLISFFKPYV